MLTIRTIKLVCSHPGVETELTKTSELNIKKLYRDRIDMFVSTKLSGWALVKKNFPNQTQRFSVDKTVLFSAMVDVMFSSKDQALIGQFKQGLKEIRSNGRYEEILSQYAPE